MPQVEQQPPTVLAMIIADMVHTDPATGKKMSNGGTTAARSAGRALPPPRSRRRVVPVAADGERPRRRLR